MSNMEKRYRNKIIVIIIIIDIMEYSSRGGHPCCSMKVS